MNKYVFKADLKVVEEAECLTAAGRSFQTVGAWYEKDLCPFDFVLKNGTLNCRVSVDERSCREGVYVCRSSNTRELFR